MLNRSLTVTHASSHRLAPARLVFVASLILSCLGAISVDAKAQTAVEIPTQSDWEDLGVVLSKGPPGSWDVRLWGALSPCTVVKKDGTYFLYYIGADGDRVLSDDGPRHRALGVATSSDGINFTKYPGNPIITFLPHNNEEEGVFSCGATLDVSGEVVLYYGAMDAGTSTSTSVSADGRLAISSNGLDFTDQGVVISYDDPSVYNFGDELYPVGVFTAEGQWHVYYIGTGNAGAWKLGLASGSNMDNISSLTRPVDTVSETFSGTDPVWVAPNKIALFINRGLSSRDIYVSTASSSFPEVLDAVIEVYDFPDFRHATTFFDEESNIWLMYYLNSAGDAIKMKRVVLDVTSTAPVAPTGLRTTVIKP